MSRNQSLTLFERVHERVLRNLSEMSSDPYRFGGRGSVLEQDLVRALEWEHEKCRRLENELDRVKTRKRHAVRKAISLFEQLEAVEGALREARNWIIEEPDVGDLADWRGRLLNRIDKALSNPARCPVCEGIDQPGLIHNPEAPYCSERSPAKRPA